jgi:hypothetical protein
MDPARASPSKRSLENFHEIFELVANSAIPIKKTKMPMFHKII